jgi:hypothetical protein
MREWAAWMDGGLAASASSPRSRLGIERRNKEFCSHYP